jgi:iron complex outermembrane receptor protein
MVYASYSRGYKAGGFEQRIAAPVEVAGTFGVETVDSYELGLKSTLFDNTLRLNGAAFFTDYAALQCPVVVGIAPTFINCGDATIKGFELEANWTPTPEWLFDFALGYTDAGFKEGQLTPLAGTVGISEDNAFQMVPEWTLSAAATYLFSLGKNGTISPRVDWSYKSEIFRDAANTAVLRQPGYHLVNVSLAWTSDDDRYRVALTGRNVGDVNYLMAGVQQNNGGFAEGVFNRGAVWTINATVTY